MNRTQPISSESADSTSPAVRLPQFNQAGRTSGCRTVAVLLNGTRSAETALPYAMSLAANSGGTLRLVRVFSHLEDIQPWHFSQAAAGIKTSQWEKQDYLSRLARRARRIKGLQVETVLIDSSRTIEALISGTVGADLVVVSSQRRGFWTRCWWMNTVDQLRRRLAVPLLVTAEQTWPIDWTATPQFANVLVPLDGSVLSQSILSSAVPLVLPSDSALTLLNVQDPQWSQGFFEHTTPRGHLLASIQRLQAAQIAADAEILTTSTGVGPAVARYAQSHGIDLIAIASRGDAGLSRFVRGSVTDYLLRNTTLPILLQSIPPWKRPEILSVA